MSADRDADEREREPAPGTRRENEQAAEEVGGDGDQVVPRGEELAALRRRAVEPALRQQPVERATNAA